MIIFGSGSQLCRCPVSQFSRAIPVNLDGPPAM